MGAAVRISSSAAVVALAIACDSSVRVGELRPEPAPPGPLVPDGEDEDAGARKTSWRLHEPSVPCTIYAMAEVRTDLLYLGCNGGRIYRFDGVRAKLALQVEDTSLFSLLWVTPDGQVWAGAQSSYEAGATTQLHHFDGTRWSKHGDASKRFTSIAGVGSDVWFATEREILHLEGGALVPSFTVTKGALRACSFSAPDKGHCVGTAGLAVAWDGATWTDLAGVPWSAAAEVFGVEDDGFSKRTTFFYGEPLEHPNGDHSCRAAQLSAGTLSAGQAQRPCFPDFRIARKRTGKVVVGGRTFMLLAPNASYGGALVFDLGADTLEQLCGPVLAFSTGLANTRAGGLYGLLATLVGSGGNQIALDAASGSSLDSVDLSVAPDGTAWARVEDRTACGSISDRLVRFEDGAFRPVAAPQGALSGRGLAAVAADRAYTIDLGTDRLFAYAAGGWREGPELEEPWSLFATKADDVWIGGARSSFGHYDGETFTSVEPPGRRRQVEQILAVGDDVWMLQQGVVADDTDEHVVRYANGEITEWNIGLQRSRVRLAALDASRVYRSGSPAQVWDGTRWKSLGFDASGVWGRSPEEVYFTDRGDIWRWDGRRRELAYHGFIPITAIAGAKDRGFAVGPGGLTIELAEWPAEQH